MKTKFYFLRSLFFTLLLSFGVGEIANAQTINLAVENFSTGGDGTNGSLNNVLLYTLTISNIPSSTNATLIDPIPVGTSYVTGSTLLNGASVPDISGTMPFATGGPFSLTAGGNYQVVFRVRITSNVGPIVNRDAKLQVPGVGDIPSSPTSTTTTLPPLPNLCSRIYALTTRTPNGHETRPPRGISPYRLISTIFSSGAPDGDIYDGLSGPCKEAPLNGSTPIDLMPGSILTDGTAMAQLPNTFRLFFVNKPVGGVAGDLCYINIEDFADGYIAYRYTNQKLTSTTTSDITRMCFDGTGMGYAITEDGQQFISFSVNLVTNVPTINPPVTLTPDPSNSFHNFFAETGGDICSDGSGKLLFIPNSGNVYSIDPAVNVVKYIGSISGMPADGCTSIALDGAGFLYIGGFYNEIYKVTLSTLTATFYPNISIYPSGDFASCIMPSVLARIGSNENTTVNNPAIPSLSAEVSAKVQPNPFHKELNLQVQLKTAEVVKVRLIDFFGRTVYTTTEKMGAGANSLHLPVPANLGPGMYVVELWAGNNRLLQQKLLKQ